VVFLHLLLCHLLEVSSDQLVLRVHPLDQLLVRLEHSLVQQLVLPAFPYHRRPEPEEV
jgi:hypothetical protein